MTALVLTLLVSLGIGAGIYWAVTGRRRKRAELLLTALPDSWRDVLLKDFPRYRSLPTELRDSLDGHLQVLIAEKNFEACGDLEEVTDQMKVLISAQAALLLIRLKKHNFYSKLKSILVYPTAFYDSGRRRFDLREEQDDHTLLGESWDSGSVILSWESVVAGARNADDGMNVTIHEFAHQLDQVDGAADGAPILQNRQAYRQWAKVFAANYEELLEEVESGKGHRSLIDPYGATNPAEFFAVASETFYEEPRQLKREHPDLYSELESFYGVDPASWPKV